MLGGFGSSTSAGLASGGTVDGDLVITGDFKVEGAGSFAYDEIIQGTIGATRVNIGTRDASGNPPTDNASYMLQIEKYGGTANIKLSRTGNASSEWSNIHNEATIGTITEHPFVLQTHSTDRLTITSAGLVGIGGTPSHPLHINSSVANGQLMRLHNTNNGDGTFIKFTGAHSTSEDWQIGSGTLGYYIYNLTDSSMGLMVSNAGNVGIGTTSPNTNLEVVGTIRASGATPAIQLKETDTTNAIQGFQINSSGGSISFNSLNNNDGFTSTDYQMHRTGSGAYYHKWFIANSSKMILNNSGNLGIGTDSPTLSKLQINTSSSTRGLVINATDSNASYMQFSNSTTGTSTSQGLQIGLQVDESAFIDLKYSSHLAIATAGTERMRITSSGNIGIGTTSPSDYSSVANKLVVADSGNSGITVASGTTSYGALYFADGTSGSAEYMGAMEYNHNGNVMKIFANGAVGIQLDSTSRISLSNNDSGDDNTILGYNAVLFSPLFTAAKASIPIAVFASPVLTAYKAPEPTAVE